MNALEMSPVIRSTPTDSLSVFRPKRATRPTQTLSLANAECGVVLRVGGQFSLDLGDQSWNVRVRDQAILDTVDGETFQALQTGKTKLYATRNFAPDNQGPPGATRKLFVEIPVTVLG